jgi:autotransporter-associated beta strand protein
MKRKSFCRSPLSRPFLAVMVISFTAPWVHAQSTAWVGNGGGGTTQLFPTAIWGGVANWTGSSVASGAGNTATFGTSFNNGYACTVNTARIIGNITYNDPANANDFILRTHGSDFILTLDVTTGQSVVNVAQAGRTLVIEPRVAGTDGIAKNGLGRLVLLNPNSTYTGPIAVNGGILEFGGGSFTFSRGTATNGPLEQTFNFPFAGRVGNGSYSGTVTIGTDAQFVYNSNSNTNLLGNISGPGSITKGQTGILTLSGTNTYGGGTRVTGGALLAAVPAALPGYDQAGKVHFDGGTIGVVMGASPTNWTTTDLDVLLANATKTAGALGIDTSNGDLIQWTPFGTSYLGATLGLTKLGGNILTLNVGNNYTGATTVTGGVLALSGAGTLGDGTGGLTLNGGKLDLGSLSRSVGAVSITAAAAEGDTIANGSLTGSAYAASNTAGNAVISANLLANGDTGFTKTGAGTVTLAGVNTYTGTTAVAAGTLQFSTAGSSVSDVTVADGAKVGVLVAANNGQAVSTGDVTMADNSSLLVNFGGSVPSTTIAPMKVADFVAGANVSLRVQADSFTGLTVGQSFPLLTWTGTGPADASAISSLVLAHRVQGNLSVTGGNTLALNMTYNAPGPISWNTGNGIWDKVTNNWLDSAAAPTAFIDILDNVILGDAPGATGNPTLTLETLLAPLSVTMNSTSRDYSLIGAGALSGAASLTLAATNTRTLSVATYLNEYSGDTVISGGTLKLLEFDVIPHGAGKGNLTINAPGVLDLNSQPETVNGLSGTGTVDTVAGDGSPIFTVGSNNANSTFNGVIKNTTGSLGLTKTGTGRLILTGTNTYTGGTIVNGGVLQVGDGGTAGTLGGGAITISTGTLEFKRSDDLIISGELSGGGGITQGGTGTVTLSGENTYSGATTVNAGTMLLTGNRVANSGAITVSSGAVLGISNGSFSLGTANFSVGNTSGVSTLNQTGGNITFSGGNQLLVGNLTGDGVYNLSAGTLTTVNVANRGVMLGVNTGRSGTFNLSGTGVLAMGATSVLHLGRGENTAATATKGYFNQTGGTATVGELRIGGSTVGAANNAGTTGELNLTAGTFTAASFTQLSGGNNSVSTIHIGGTADVTLPAFPTGRGAGATATLTFDGGVLKPAAPSLSYIGGLTSAFIMDGGATIDTTNGDITITQALLAHGTSTGGGLTKAGPGVLTLAAANSYTGGTTVSAGTLALATVNPDNETSTVTLAATDAKLQLTFAGTDTVGKLVIGTTQQPDGQYGHTDSGANNGGLGVGAMNAYFAPGTGILKVGTGGGETFAQWIATFSGVGSLNGFNDDADGDGIRNGVENFFGTNPGVFSTGLVVGQASGNTFTFTHQQSASPASDIAAAYRWSKDLATFRASGASDGSDTTVTFSTQANTPAAGMTTVTATVTGTPVNRLFVDVVVTQQP